MFNPKLSLYLFEGPVDRALGYLHGRRLRLVCPSGEFIAAFPAFPDAGTLTLNGLHVTFRAAVESPGNRFDICNSFTYKSSIPATKTS
jgi:hypothetical protein